MNKHQEFNLSNKIKIFILFVPMVLIIFYLSNIYERNLFNSYNSTFSNFIFVFFIYSLSQLMRIFRFTLIANQLIKLRFRVIMFFYYNSALLLLIAPFKLGEIYRLFLLIKISKELLRPILITLVEKTLDAFFILLFLCLIIFVFKIPLDNFYFFVTIFLTSIIGFFIFVLWILGPILMTTQSYILEKHNSSFSLTLNKILYNINKSINDVKKMLNGKILTLISFSILIYCLEALAVYLSVFNNTGSVYEEIKNNIKYSFFFNNLSNNIQPNILINLFTILCFQWVLSIVIMIFLNLKKIK